MAKIDYSLGTKVLRILKENTDEQTPITIKEIVEELNYEYDRRSVSKVLIDLEDSNLLKTGKVSGKKGIYFVKEKTDLEISDVRALIELIACSKHLDRALSDKLANKLLNQISKNEAERIPTMFDNVSNGDVIWFKTKKWNVHSVVKAFGSQNCTVKKDIGENVEIRVLTSKSEAIDFVFDTLGDVEVIEPRDVRVEIRGVAQKIRKQYLEEERDLYLSEIELLKTTNKKEMNLENINISNWHEHKKYDVERIFFKRVNESDISFVSGKKNLRSFCSISNPIVVYDFLKDAMGLKEISIIFNEEDYSLEFIKDCKSLESLLIGDTNRVKNVDCLYQPLNLKRLLLFYETTVDIEKFKKYNPDTEIIIGRDEAEKAMGISKNIFVPVEEYKISDEKSETMETKDWLMALLDNYRKAKNRKKYE
ncbi:MAG: hypothetical protein IJW54_01145 [Clostridia bacterium]|nr:hypothetical protein [Clostridia bacterium]